MLIKFHCDILVKQKKNKNKKKKNVVKETDETLTTNVQPLIATEPVTSTVSKTKNFCFLILKFMYGPKYITCKRLFYS